MDFLLSWRFILMQALFSQLYLFPLWVIVASALHSKKCWELLDMSHSFFSESMAILVIISAVAAFAHVNNPYRNHSQKELLLVISRLLSVAAVLLTLIQPLLFREHKVILCILALLQFCLFFLFWFIAEMAITGTWL